MIRREPTRIDLKLDDDFHEYNEFSAVMVQAKRQIEMNHHSKHAPVKRVASYHEQRRFQSAVSAFTAVGTQSTVATGPSQVLSSQGWSATPISSSQPGDAIVDYDELE